MYTSTYVQTYYIYIHVYIPNHRNIYMYTNIHAHIVHASTCIHARATKFLHVATSRHGHKGCLRLSLPAKKQSRTDFTFTDVWISYEIFRKSLYENGKSARLSFLPGRLKHKQLYVFPPTHIHERNHKQSC